MGGEEGAGEKVSAETREELEGKVVREDEDICEKEEDDEKEEEEERGGGEEKEEEEVEVEGEEGA